MLPFVWCNGHVESGAGAAVQKVVDALDIPLLVFSALISKSVDGSIPPVKLCDVSEDVASTVNHSLGYTGETNGDA